MILAWASPFNIQSSDSELPRIHVFSPSVKGRLPHLGGISK